MAAAPEPPTLSSNGRRLIEKMTELPRTWLTAATLATAVGISRRTVLRELPGIEQWMRSAGFRFLRSPGKGLLLDEDQERRALLLSLLETRGASNALSRQERRRQVLLTLLSAEEPVKIYALAHQLNSSDYTLSADLDAVEDYLRTWGIALRRRPGVGVWLEAPPEKLRRAAGTLLKTQLLEQDWQSFFHGTAPQGTPLAVLLDPETARTVWEVLQRFDEEEALHFADSHFLSLAVHLTLTVRQLRSGIADTGAPVPHTDAAQARRLAKRLEQALGVALPPAEVSNLALYLDAYGQSAGPDSREMNLRYLVAYLLNGVSEAMEVDLTPYPDLADDLCRHLRPMLLRLEHNTYTENPQLTLLQEQYPALWRATRAVCDKAQEALPIPAIPDGEAGYLAMHIGAVLEQENLAKMRLNAVVVCPYGMASSRFLAAQLARDFPVLNITACCAVRELDPAALRKQGVDLIISTAALQIDYPHVRINPILQAQDRALLQDAIETAQQQALTPSRSGKKPRSEQREALRYTVKLSAELLNLLKNVTIQRVTAPQSREALIHAASGLFCSDAQAALKVEQALLRREGLGDTYVKPLQALLLHCRTDALRECRLGYLCAEPPLYENRQRILGALVLLAPAEGDIPLEVMQAVSALLIEEPALIDALRKNERDRAAALLEAGLGQRFQHVLTMRLRP